MMKEGSCCSSSSCGGCRWVAPGIFALTMLLLLLVQLGLGMGVFGEWVMKLWPAGVLAYALSRFCPCKSCKSM